MLDIATISLAVVSVLLLQAFITRSASASVAKHAKQVNKQNIIGLPYWIPYFGHLLEVIFWGDGFLQRARNSVEDGAFGITILDQRYNVIYTPALVAAAEQKEESALDYDTPIIKILQSTFSLTVSEKDELRSFLKGKDSPFLPPPVKTAITAAALRTLQTSVPDILSFMSNLIDQLPWERYTLFSITDPESEGSSSSDSTSADVDFHLLLRNFITHHLVLTLLPHSLLETHAHAQTFVNDVWAMNSGLFPMSLGLPRYLPVPRLTSAHIARRKLLWTLTTMFQALDALADGKEAVGEWKNIDDELDDLSPFLKHVQETCKALSPTARASLTLVHVLSLSARIANIAFWTLLNIVQRGLVAQVREESKAVVKATQPPKEFGIAESIRLAIDVEALSDTGTGRSCPLLQNSYLETQRLYDRSFGLAHVGKSCEIGGGGDSDSARQAVRMQGGTMLATVPWLHNLDNKQFVQPMKWDLEGRLQNERDRVVAPSGLDLRFAGGEEVVRPLSMGVIAGVLAAWDIEILNGVPKAARSVTVAGPKRVVRARMKRREL